MNTLVWHLDEDPPTKGPGQWFSDEPEHDGYYWRKPHLTSEADPDVYWLQATEDGRVRVFTMNSSAWVDEMGGWWLGPLAPPD